MDVIRMKRNLQYGALQAVYWMSQCTVFNYAAVFLLSRSFDNKLIGMILAAANLLSVFFQPAAAAVADRSTRFSLQGIIAALAGVAFVCSLSMLFPLPKVVLGVVFTVLLMIMLSLLPLINAMVFATDTARCINFNAARVAGSLAYAVVSYAMGLGITRFGEDLLTVVNVLLFAAISLLALSFRSKSSKKGQPISQKPVPSTAEGSFFQRNHRFVLMLIGLVPVFFCYNLFAAYLIHLIEGVGGTSADMGNALAICGFLEIPVILFYGKLRKNFSDRLLFAVSVIFFTVKALTLTMAGSVVGVYAAEGLHAVSFALFLPASVHYANEMVCDGDRVKGQAMMTAAGTTGSVLATAIGGLMLESMGVRWMVAAGTLCSAVGTVIACLSIFRVSEKKNRMG